MGLKERREREKADVRERILDAARELFARDGIEAVTMRAIANAIEYSAPVIYSHFADKQSLIQELCYRDFRALAQAFGKIGRIEDPIDRLRRIGEAYVDFALEHPSQYRFLFMTPKPAGAQDMMLQGEMKGNPEEDAYGFLSNTVAEGITAGCFRPEYRDVEELAQMVWATTHGIVSLQLAKADCPWIEWRDARTTANKLVDAVLRGIIRDPLSFSSSSALSSSSSFSPS
jgi:AcrR family transcriptional regulator